MPVIAITVDTEFPDQPAADPLGALDKMLALLSRHRAEATFFVTGSWAGAHPDRVAALQRGRHLVGNHSFSHRPLSRLTDAGIAEDLGMCEVTLKRLGIDTRPWFRAPYGDLGEDPSRVTAAIRNAGYKHVPWHANGEDWRPGRDAGEIARATIDDVHRRWPQPAIVLFHSWPDPAPQALDLVLTELRKEKATFVRLDRIRFGDAALGRLRAAIAVVSSATSANK